MKIASVTQYAPRVMKPARIRNQKKIGTPLVWGSAAAFMASSVMAQETADSALSVQFNPSTQVTQRDEFIAGLVPFHMQALGNSWNKIRNHIVARIKGEGGSGEGASSLRHFVEAQLAGRIAARNGKASVADPVGSVTGLDAKQLATRWYKEYLLPTWIEDATGGKEKQAFLLERPKDGPVRGYAMLRPFPTPDVGYFNVDPSTPVGYFPGLVLGNKDKRTVAKRLVNGVLEKAKAHQYTYVLAELRKNSQNFSLINSVLTHEFGFVPIDNGSESSPASVRDKIDWNRLDHGRIRYFGKSLDEA